MKTQAKACGYGLVATQIFVICPWFLSTYDDFSTTD